MITTGTHIIYSSDGLKARSEILKEIIEANFPDVSIAGIEDDLVEMDVNYFEIPFIYNSEHKKTLMVGLAGGAVARELVKKYNLEMDVVEIEPKMLDFARKYFYWNNEAKGNAAYTPIGRDRKVSKALQIYALMASSADNGAVRILP